MHVLTTQERHVAGCLLAIVTHHDHWCQRCAPLERDLPGLDG